MNDQSVKFEWYEVVQGNGIEQGDFLNDFPILIQPDTFPTSKNELQLLESGDMTIDNVSVDLVDVVVMTQSCDFNKMDDLSLVTLCPRFEYRRRYGKDRWKPLIEGRVVGAHLLNKCDIGGHEFDYQVVDLTRLFSVRYNYVRKFASETGQRVRLLPPYREHLSQSFARRYMRVGLPIDLPRDYPY